MKSRDLCYWLMGMLELTNPTELNSEQKLIIKRHLDLVFKHEIDPSQGITISSSSRDFCFWLKGVIDISISVGSHKQPNLVGLIRRRLDLVFKHEIDPSQGTPEHQAELQAIHDGHQDTPQLGDLQEFLEQSDNQGFDPGLLDDDLLRC